MSYNGNSESFKGLFQDYFSYAQGVNTGRSFPDVRDGLKPVHRRVLYALSQKGQRTLIKSSSVIGLTMEFHPHGDASIYDALVLMSDKNGSWNVPLIKSAGSWGKVYSSEAMASAPRYTESCLGEWSEDFLGDLQYTPYVPREMGEGLEPEVLPARYPFMLTVGHSGMGVGLATNIPPFNFWDIISLTRVFLENGKWDNEVILPDFPTGGEIVNDLREALKLMYSGTAKFQIRAKYDVDNTGTVISVLEVPYGLSAEKMVDKIKSLNLEDVKSVVSSVDLNGCGVTVVCKRGTAWDVERVLLKKGVLQLSYSTFMVWTLGGECHQGGVYRCIEEWVNFRKEVLKKKFSSELTGLKSDLERLEYFVLLVGDEPARDVYVDRVLHKSKGDADEWLREYFKNTYDKVIPSDVVDWIYSRRLSAFKRGNAYAEKFDKLTQELKTLEWKLEHLSETILADLDALEKEHEGFHYRKTELSDVLVKFSKDTVAKDYEQCSFSFDPVEGTLIKRKASTGGRTGEKRVRGSEEDCVLGLTASGHVVKWWGDQLEWGEHSSGEDMIGDRVLDVLDPAKKDWVLFYQDGTYSYLSTEALTSGRRTKTKKNYLPELYGLVSVQPLDDLKTVTYGYISEGTAYVETVDLGNITLPTSPKKRLQLSKYLPEFVGFNVTLPEPVHEIGTGGSDKGVDYDTALVSLEVE